MAMTLSALAGEYRRLEEARRARGLTEPEAERRRAVLGELSAALSQRDVAVERRQFLRVPCPALVAYRRRGELLQVPALDVGSGGLLLAGDVGLTVGEEIDLEAMRLAGEHFPLVGRAAVAWTSPDGAGVAFIVDRAAMEAQIDAVLYRALHLFLGAEAAAAAG